MRLMKPSSDTDPKVRHWQGHGVSMSRPRLYEMTSNLAYLGRRRPTYDDLLDAAELRPGNRVLDVGCGPGPSVLAATEWGDRSQPTVVLLHGMLGSAQYWRDVAALLPDRRVIALDLLGFGASPQPASADYDYAEHCGAVVTTLDSLGVREPVVLAGHSMGALIALRLAADHPDRVSSLTLLGMPVFDSATAARAAIGSTRLRRALLYGVTSRLFCRVWCQMLKPISRRTAQFYLRTVPSAVASATVEHSWRSYSRSLTNIVENQTVTEDLQRVTCPTLIVHGDRDADASLPTNWRLKVRTRVLILPGAHQLPLERPLDVADLLRANRPEPGDTSGRGHDR